MRKFTSILLFAIAFAQTIFAAPPAITSGTYKVGSTSGADFALLSQAIDAINAATITGDVVLEITSDITEPTNFGLAKDLGNYNLTIRPDADADRTITFTQATANAGPWGHFVIGCSTANLAAAISETTLQSTNNVVIDGYPANGTTSRLKFTTTGDALTNSILTDIVGDCKNITIKNCIYDNKSIGSTSRCVYLFAVKNGTKDVAPSNILIENNQIVCFPSTSVNGLGIQGNSTGSPTARISGLVIKNNYIKARSTGVEVNFCDGVNISGNEIRVQKGTTTGSGIGVWLRGSKGDMFVTGNKFTEISSIQTGTGSYATQGILTGATSSNPFNVNIFNNTFSGMDRSVAGPAALNQTYIAEIGYGTTKIYHNTFYLPALTLPTQAGAYNAISYTTTSYKADIQNNIFISNEDAKSVLVSKAVTTGTMNNNIYYLRAGNTNARVIDTYSTLSAFQQANSSLEVNSKWADARFVDTTTGNLLLAGTSVQDGNLKVPALAAVTTDITGKTRNTEFTYAGAHESDLPFIITSLEKTAKESPLKVTASGIEIAANGAVVEVLTPNGMTICRTVVSGSFSRSLSAGIYIVRINGKAYKIIK